ncbi:DUF4232 domain-containing protein [Kitasatospora sp. NPDC094019]|uniref:DUF4232 domain-containing protein n=1 Tax=Kitasatospora sp. NPDC094019 TaxID=3364091 RepID=UPI003811B318
MPGDLVHPYFYCLGGFVMTVRRTLLVPAALVGAVLAVTGCGPDDTGGPAPAKTAAAAASAPGAAGPTSAPAGAPTVPSAAAVPSSSAPSATAASRTTAPAPGGGTDDAYAYTHPCEGKDLAIRVTARPEVPSQRVIEVRNQGPRSCGVSYFPLVSLGDSHAADRGKDIRPLVPGGLGGPPAYPVGAGRTAFAVLDLSPAGGSGTSAAGVDELNVLAGGEHMPAAETRNFPLGAGAKVRAPRLGLYRATAAEAVESAATADQRQA